jgi:hypothetical protein
MKDITWSCWFTVVIVSTTFCCLLDECLGLKLCPASHDSQRNSVGKRANDDGSKQLCVSGPAKATESLCQQ